MRFKKYDIVKVIEPFWEHDKVDTRLNKEAIITEVHGGYELTFFEGLGTSAWWHDYQLSFVREGNENIAKAAKQEIEARIKQEQSWGWIKKHWSDGTISTATMSFLLEEIGYRSAFVQNGEFYALFMDFRIIYPIFKCIFEDKLDEAFAIAEKIFKPESHEKAKEKIQYCYDSFWNAWNV